MKNSGYELKMPEVRRKMFYFLKERSIREEFALRLVDRAREIDDLEKIMMEDMDTVGAFVNPLKKSGSAYQRKEKRIVMLIGPTGVGKTTTLAKLASKAIKEGSRVAMISIDTYKIGAAEQIRIYSRMIGIPLDIVSSSVNLRKSINRFHDRDIILIDSTGQNPREKDYIDNLRNIYKTGLPIETQLLLSASSDCDFLMDTHKNYSSLPVNYIAFTKTDEAVKLGSIYNLCRHYRKPVAYITTGQKVPGNIEFVDSRKLTNLILRTGSA
jgi:flagellar biosynthesis protein FlhF